VVQGVGSANEHGIDVGMLDDLASVIAEEVRAIFPGRGLQAIEASGVQGDDSRVVRTVTDLLTLGTADETGGTQNTELELHSLVPLTSHRLAVPSVPTPARLERWR